MIEKRPLVYYCIALLFGCYSALFLLNNNFFGAVLAASFLSCMFLTQHSKLTFITVIFLCIGFVNYYLYFSIVPPKTFIARLEKIKSFNSIGEYKGRKVLLKGKFEDFNEGDMIYVSGEFQCLPQFEKGIVGEVKVEKIIKGKEDFMSSIYRFKRNLYEGYKRNIGDKPAAEIMAVAFGDDSYIEQDTMEEMNTLGIVHVLSVSGLHIALIYKLCESFLGFGGGLLISIIYCIFTGGASSTLRSLIMIIVFKLSKKVYRNYDQLSALSLAAIIVIVMKPFYVLDVGSLLSFLAVLGILMMYNKIKKALYFIPVKLNEYVSLTFSAQVFTLPLCIMVFNSMSTASIQGNIFLVPLYSLLLVLGNVAMLLFNFSYLFEKTCLLLKVVYNAIEGGRGILLNVSTGIMYLSWVDAWVLIIIYISYIFVKRGYQKAKWLPLFSIVFCLCCNFSLYPTIEYIKVGSNKGVIYRSAFKSILFLEKLKLKEKDTFLSKKFNVLKIRDMGKTKLITYSDGDLQLLINTKKAEPTVRVEAKGQSFNIVFTKGDIPVFNEEIYDIMYVKYKQKAYKFYDKLAEAKIKFNIK